jgi:zinc protease
VRNERGENIENCAVRLGEEEIAHLLFPPGHPYYASIMGSHADIQSAQLEDVRAVLPALLRAQQRDAGVGG